MAASMGDEFDDWLSQKLTKICEDVDLEVFVQYIRGVVETETDLEDKTDSITDILGQITEDDLETHCDDILNKWNEVNGGAASSPEKKDAFDNFMATAIETQKTQTFKTKELSAEEKARKQAILAQYSQVS